MGRIRTWAIVIAGLVVALALAGQVAVTKPAQARWTDNYKAALFQAKEENKLILLNFTGSDWCTACATLHAKIFESPEFAAWAAEKLVLVEVDFPNNKKLPDELAKQNAELKTTYLALGYPTVVILDADKNMLTWTPGYWGDTPAEWIAARRQGIADTRLAMAKRQALIQRTNK